MKHKTNPNRRPASQADVARAKVKARDEAISLSIALFLTVMLDKFGFDAEQLQKVWAEVNDLSDSVAKGYVDLHDLRAVLRDEYGVAIS